MRYFTLFIVLLSSMAVWAQTDPQMEPVQEPSATPEVAAAPVQTVSKSSIAAHRVDSKLNEVTLHKTVLDYSLPPEIEDAARTCTQGEEDCYFTFKTFENSTDKKISAAATWESAAFSNVLNAK